MVLVTVTAYFTAEGVPQTNLTPVIRIRKADTGVLVVTDASMYLMGDGGYAYDFSGDDYQKYSARCDGGSDALDSRYTFTAFETDATTSGQDGRIV